MALVTKKDEKIELLVNKLGRDCDKDEFVLNFKMDYPKDWKKINDKYTNHEYANQNKKKPTHPMPIPEQYIKNMLNVWLKKQLKK